MTAVATAVTEQLGGVASASVPAHRGPVITGAVLATAAGLAFVVGHDGSPAWQLARVVAVGGLTLAVLAGTAMPRGAARAATALVTGLVTVPVGIGIAFPHLTKTGIHAMGVAGGLLLAGALVLLATGALWLLRLAGRWWRMPATAGLVLVASLLVWSLGQAVAATNVPRVELASATPADRGLRYRDVEFLTTDGVALSGWYIPSSNGAAVVLLHGAGSTRSGVLDHAVVLAEHGYGVMLFDARGHGRSDGRAMGFGWYGDQDIRGAVSFLVAEPDVDPERIAAIGMSMGGEEAIGAAATDHRIRAVVAEGATNRVPGDKAWLSDEFGWRGVVQERVEWLVYNTTDLLTVADQPIALRDALRAAAPRPVLLIAAGDVADETLAASYFQRGSPATVQLWTVPRTGHTAGLETHPEEWEDRVVAFLENSLRSSAE